jgi:hypothetical protein
MMSTKNSTAVKTVRKDIHAVIHCEKREDCKLRDHLVCVVLTALATFIVLRLFGDATAAFAPMAGGSVQEYIDWMRKLT